MAKQLKPLEKFCTDRWLLSGENGRVRVGRGERGQSFHGALNAMRRRFGWSRKICMNKESEIFGYDGLWKLVRLVPRFSKLRCRRALRRTAQILSESASEEVLLSSTAVSAPRTETDRDAREWGCMTDGSSLRSSGTASSSSSTSELSEAELQLPPTARWASSPSLSVSPTIETIPLPAAGFAMSRANLLTLFVLTLLVLIPLYALH